MQPKGHFQQQKPAVCWNTSWLVSNYLCIIKQKANCARLLRNFGNTCTDESMIWMKRTFPLACVYIRISDVARFLRTLCAALSGIPIWNRGLARHPQAWYLVSRRAYSWWCTRSHLFYAWMGSCFHAWGRAFANFVPITTYSKYGSGIAVAAWPSKSRHSTGGC